MWIEIPAMLAVRSDDDLERMKGVCRKQQIRFAFGHQKELDDATKMLHLINKEVRQRAQAALEARVMLN